MIATALLKLMFFPIDYHSRNLLIHEDQDGAQQSRQYGEHRGPDRVLLVEWLNEPASIRNGWFELPRDFQLRRRDVGDVIQCAHREDRNDDSKVANKLSDVRWEEQGILEVLENDRNDVRSDEQDDRHQEDIGDVLGFGAVVTGEGTVQ